MLSTESLRLYQRGSTLAAADAKVPQAPERAQLILDVVQTLGNLQGLGPRCGRVRSRPLRLHQRHAQCCEELHLAAVASSRARFEARQRAFDPPTTLEHQRLLEPQRHGSGGERHADRRIPARRKGPVQCRSHVVGMAGICAQPLGGGPDLPFGLGPLEEIPVVFGVPSGDRLGLAALREFLEGVGPCRLEEPVMH